MNLKNMTTNDIFFRTFKDVPGHFVELLKADSNLSRFDYSPQGMGICSNFHSDKIDKTIYCRNYNIYYPRGLIKGKKLVDFYIKISQKNEQNFFSCLFEITISNDKEEINESLTRSYFHPILFVDPDWEKLFKEENKHKYHSCNNYFNSIIDEYIINEQFKHHIDELLEYGAQFV
jgi:hypothetical protein